METDALNELSKELRKVQGELRKARLKLESLKPENAGRDYWYLSIKEKYQEDEAKKLIADIATEIISQYKVERDLLVFSATLDYNKVLRACNLEQNDNNIFLIAEVKNDLIKLIEKNF